MNRRIIKYGPITIFGIVMIICMALPRIGNFIYALFPKVLVLQHPIEEIRFYIALALLLAVYPILYGNKYVGFIYLAVCALFLYQIEFTLFSWLASIVMGEPKVHFSFLLGVPLIVGFSLSFVYASLSKREVLLVNSVIGMSAILSVYHSYAIWSSYH